MTPAAPITPDAVSANALQLTSQGQVMPPSTSGSQGPFFPATAADVAAGSGSAPWSNVNNAKQQDGSSATVTFSIGGQPSDWLEVTAFGFSVPASATVVGIQFDELRQAGFGDANDNAMALVLAGAITAAAPTVRPAARWPSALTWVTFGGPTDLWGGNPHPADVNAAGFGFAHSIVCTAGGITASIDAIRATVYYTT